MSNLEKTARSEPPGPSAAEPAEQPSVRKATSRRRVVSLIVATGAVMASLDLTIVNVAFPLMARDFPSSSLAELSWTLSAYAILYAAALVPAGRLADRSGRKQAFMAGLAIFTLASALCALSPTLGVLIAARAVQAIGAAAMVPTSLSLMMVAYPAEARAKAVRVWTAAGAVPGAFGPFVGGLLVDADWRWIFVVNVPVGIAALLAAHRLLPQAGARSTAALPDLLGALVLIGGIGSVTLAIVQANDWGWASVGTLGSLAAGAALLAYFLVRSARHPSPIISLPLLRIRSFAIANVTILVYGAGFAAAILSVSLWCQNIWGWSPLVTGLALTPGNVLLLITSMSGGPLTRRLGANPVVALGCALLAAGGLWWALTTGLPVAYLGALLPGLVATRIGIGLALPALVGSAAADLPPAELATGSGINAMVRQVGTALGFSITVLIIGSPRRPHDILHNYHASWVFLAVSATVAGLIAIILFAVSRNAVSPNTVSPNTVSPNTVSPNAASGEPAGK